VAAAAAAAMHPADLAVLQDLSKSLTTADLLAWPDDGSDACAWRHVSCDQSGRVDNLDLKKLGLAGELPASFSTLAALNDLSLQANRLSGPLPSFRGMASLEHVYLNDNAFASIPADFFQGLSGLLFVSLSNNPGLNASSGGWAISNDIATSSPQLQVLQLDNCSLVGAIPDSLGTMSSLQNLTLAYNSLTGPIPASFNASALQLLHLNNQQGETRLSGPLDVVATITSLQTLWLHGNQFSGPIPDDIGACTALQSLRLSNNLLVGLVPPALATIPHLTEVWLDNNMFLGPVPALKAGNITFSNTGFCTQTPGVACSPEITALLQFLAQVEYPAALLSTWTGNNPCAPWLGVTCEDRSQVTGLSLPNHAFHGTISRSLGDLTNLSTIKLNGNNLTGQVPDSLTNLTSLQELDLSMNDLSGPLPNFRPTVKVNVAGNPSFNSTAPHTPPNNDKPATPGTPSSSGHPLSPPATQGSEKKHSSVLVLVLATTIPVVLSVVALISVGAVCFCKKRAPMPPQAASVVVHPRDSSDPDSLAKIVVVTNDTNSSTSQGNTNSGGNSSVFGDVQMLDVHNFRISVHVLRGATKNFAQENVLGRGGFGVVYKGELHDGTMIAVKRMESAVVSNKASDEFQAEIAVLTKVRHRNLVSILGYSTEGIERLLVYEFMPNGALSKHLFHWKQFELEPLSWKKRLNIALDVSRGMEYLHNLGHHRFIHRDLKSANILLGDDFRAKVADFGLMKDAPDGNMSVATRLAGTFGYLAPEYAGKNLRAWSDLKICELGPT
jgi:Leucine-rich repeat (LRR) protein